jgi:Transposase
MLDRGAHSCPSRRPDNQLHRSNALVESTNTKLRLLTRVAYGFKQPEHLIALALLDRGGYCPPLPGRGR